MTDSPALPPRPSPLTLDRRRACVLLVDVQERLAAAMPRDELDRLLRHAAALLRTARELAIPVLATEQYPRGLGPTVPALRALLPAAPLAKLSFSCAGDPAAAAALEHGGRRQVILAGMETHVCVYQTARDLAAAGYQVHVCADAVASRSPDHRAIGLDLCRAAGAVVTSVETALFDLLVCAGTPEFKRVAPLIK